MGNLYKFNSLLKLTFILKVACKSGYCNLVTAIVTTAVNVLYKLYTQAQKYPPPKSLPGCQQSIIFHLNCQKSYSLVYFPAVFLPQFNTIPNKSLGSCSYTSLLDCGQRPKFWCRIGMHNFGTQLPPKQ